MTKRRSLQVILKIGEGSCDRGFPVSLQISDALHTPIAEVTGHLPAAPDLLALYHAWQSAYTNLGFAARISARPGQKTNRSVVAERADCATLAKSLVQQFNHWLSALEFRGIRECWLEKLTTDDDVLVLVQTEDLLLQKLPWHQWDILERYPKAEVALGATQFNRPARSRPLNKRVKILAILGDSEGLNIERDRSILQQLRDADVTFLVEPARRQLNDELWNQQWDILFFAGHGSSRADGQIYINQTEGLAIADLKNALRTAVSQGLQLAILNSCEGLKSAHDLAALQIPQTILMREQVPDLVAQEFLTHFLTEFAAGQSLYLAVRSARERLQGLESEFICASWLPMIYQNLAATPPTWMDLKRPQPRWHVPIVTAAMVTLAVLGVRHVGLLQTWELRAYDHLLNVRSLIQPEPPDNRILVIEINDQDYEFQKQRNESLGDKSLSDTSLVNLINILNKYQPRVIGLDLYRDAKGVPADVVKTLKNTPNLIGICKAPSDQFDPTGIAPPAGIPVDRVGFNDVPMDPDGIIRRQFLQIYQIPNSVCPPRYAFSLQLALRYLQTQGIEPKWQADKTLQLGSAHFTPISERYGAYQNVSDLNVGYQLLLNYRASQVRPLSLADVLRDQQPLAIKDRIVLIGVTRQNPPGDGYFTPYASKETNGIQGVFIVAQQVSQILSTVLDDRPLIWVWAGWIEGLWIAAWAALGALLPLWLRSPTYRGVGILVLSFTLWSGCIILFMQGGWIPLIPPLLTLCLSAGTVSLYRVYRQS